MSSGKRGGYNQRVNCSSTSTRINEINSSYGSVEAKKEHVDRLVSQKEYAPINAGTAPASAPSPQVKKPVNNTQPKKQVMQPNNQIESQAVNPVSKPASVQNTEYQAPVY